MPRHSLLLLLVLLLSLLFASAAHASQQRLSAKFFAASEKSDFKTMKKALEDGAEPMNYRDERTGLNAFLRAAQLGNVQVMKFLLDEDLADPNEADGEGTTALIMAAAEGAADAVKFLLKKRATMNRQNMRGTTALWFAAREGKASTVDALLEAGADPHLLDRDGYSAIFPALIFGHKDIALKLAKKMRRDALDHVALNGLTPIFAAAQNKAYDVVRYLVEQGAEINVRDSKGYPIVMGAMAEKDYEMVKLLLELGADPSQRSETEGWNALHAAVGSADPKMVEAVLPFATKIIDELDGKGRTALEMASILKGRSALGVEDVHGSSPLLSNNSSEAMEDRASSIADLLRKAGAQDKFAVAPIEPPADEANSADAQPQVVPSAFRAAEL